jgi:hypothetical protein
MRRGHRAGAPQPTVKLTPLMPLTRLAPLTLAALASAGVLVVS